MAAPLLVVEDYAAAAGSRTFYVVLHRGGAAVALGAKILPRLDCACGSGWLASACYETGILGQLPGAASL